MFCIASMDGVGGLLYGVSFGRGPGNGEARYSTELIYAYSFHKRLTAQWNLSTFRLTFYIR